MLNETDLSRADLNLLVLFETVMQERHVGRAAERLHLTPSAVSHGLKRLREMLGDPLFLRTPKGVTPSDRAQDLAAPIAAIMAQVRKVIRSAAPFDPATSDRCFTIGAPDGVSAVFLSQMLDALRRTAPKIDIRIRQLLPKPAESSLALAWQGVLDELESRAMDAAIVPLAEFPARFAVRTLYDEDFVIAMRKKHPFARHPKLKNYCAQDHLVVSHAGDARGFVDTALAQHRMSRRVRVTVPNFMFAIAMLAETDMLSALPRRFVEAFGARFGVIAVDPPLPLPRYKLNLVTPNVALEDEGIAWLVACLTQASQPHRAPRRPPPKRPE